MHPLHLESVETTFLQRQLVETLLTGPHVDAEVTRTAFRLFLEPGHSAWVRPAGTGQVVIVLVSVFFQTPGLMTNGLVTSYPTVLHVRSTYSSGFR